jgi:hypothetical protein
MALQHFSLVVVIFTVSTTRAQRIAAGKRWCHLNGHNELRNIAPGAKFIT